MARGTANGEPVVSQAATDDFREGYARTFGDRKPQRGRWVYDESQGKLVPAESYCPPERALDAPVMVDRFYEGVRATDGADIGSRKKHREYMRRNGLAPADDFSPGWYDRRRAELKREEDHRREKALVEASHRIWKP